MQSSEEPQISGGCLYLFGNGVLGDTQGMVGKLGTTELVLVKSLELPVDLLQSGAENNCPCTPTPHLCKAMESWQIAITFWNNEKKKVF